MTGAKVIEHTEWNLFPKPAEAGEYWHTSWQSKKGLGCHYLVPDNHSAWQKGIISTNLRVIEGFLLYISFSWVLSNHHKLVVLKATGIYFLNSEIRGGALFSAVLLRSCSMPLLVQGFDCITLISVSWSLPPYSMSSIISSFPLTRASTPGFCDNLDITVTDSKQRGEQGLEVVAGHSICSKLVGISSVLYQGGYSRTRRY